MASSDPIALDTGVSRLHVERPCGDPHRHLGRLLAEPGWLGRPVPCPPGHPELRRIATDLVFAVAGPDRPIRLQKAAFVDIGPVVRTDDGWSTTISWRASTLAPLFPIFAGVLVATPTRLILDGAYAPPGGGVGMLVDRAALRVVATRSATWFLDRIRDELDDDGP